MKTLRDWLSSMSAAAAQRRLERQQNDPRTRLLMVCVRLDESRRYVDRDRMAERRERDRLIKQREAAREKLTELEDLLRQYLAGQAIIDAQAAQRAAGQAREALASDFGALQD